MARSSSSASNKNEQVTTILMEFFDDKKNYGENEVKHGRNWTIDELRIKSNTDLHKLWYVLLKEKNMLLTMEEECKRDHRHFPSPERLDKVNMSMTNLESVVRERNKAYHELETGETGERPGELKTNVLGLHSFVKATEHVVPNYLNKKWLEAQKTPKGGHDVALFLKNLRETRWNETRKARNRDRNQVAYLLKRNPDLDRGLLQRKYPHVNIERLEKMDKFRGHFVPKL
jgi:large subunit ribosomal protein L47